MKTFSMRSLIPTYLWGDTPPKRIAYQCEWVACPLKGMARVQDCAACEWANEVTTEGESAMVQCNPPMSAILARAQASEM